MNRSEQMEEALREMVNAETDGTMDRDVLCGRCWYKMDGSCKHDGRCWVDKVMNALALPPRNCDVGSAKEQNVRFEKYCFEHRTMERCCQDCPIKDEPCCELAWAQLPYQKGEEDGK